MAETDTRLMEDESRFFGVRPEIEEILKAAKERIGTALTKERDRAAQVMARLLDPPAVDEALGLSLGTVKSWMDDEAFVKRIIEYRRLVDVNRTVEEDFGRILTPKQRQAARMRGLDFLSQTETARALHVTDRTIRNWEANPAFHMYRDQLEREEEGKRRARHRIESDKLSSAREKALEVLVRAVEDGGDCKSALGLLRLRP